MNGIRHSAALTKAAVGIRIFVWSEAALFIWLFVNRYPEVQRGKRMAKELPRENLTRATVDNLTGKMRAPGCIYAYFPYCASTDEFGL
eukprot:gene33056-5314_t